MIFGYGGWRQPKSYAYNQTVVYNTGYNDNIIIVRLYAPGTMVADVDQCMHAYNVKLWWFCWLLSFSIGLFNVIIHNWWYRSIVMSVFKYL